MGPQHPSFPETEVRRGGWRGPCTWTRPAVSSGHLGPRAAQAAVGRTNFRRTFLSPELMVSTPLICARAGGISSTPTGTWQPQATASRSANTDTNAAGWSLGQQRPFLATRIAGVNGKAGRRLSALRTPEAAEWQGVLKSKLRNRAGAGGKGCLLSRAHRRRAGAQRSCTQQFLEGCP